jgi:hypothetical protein
MPTETPGDESPKLRPGSLIKLSYEGREFDVIVIDPHGLGQGQPSLGFGYRMVDRHAGIPESTIRSWVRELNGDKTLTTPSGKAFKVRELLGSDGNDYRVLEAAEWFELAVDLLVDPGQTGKKKGTSEERIQASKTLRAKLGEFIRWFAVKGFYAEAYVAFKGVYTARDSRATTQWLESRQMGIPVRNFYTDLLQAQGCEGYDYANWTNNIYQGLFGMKKSEMVKVWDLVAGDPRIGRNYIPKAEGLDAIRYCEDMVVRVFVDDLEEAHETAVNLTKRKYLGGT